MDFTEQEHQSSEQIEEELVTLSSETPWLSEVTEVINEISVKLPSKLLITKITTSFDNNFDLLSMNNISEADFFKPRPAFKKAINETKDNNLKSIASASMNQLAITSFDDNFDLIYMNNIFELEKFVP